MKATSQERRQSIDPCQPHLTRDKDFSILHAIDVEEI